MARGQPREAQEWSGLAESADAKPEDTEQAMSLEILRASAVMGFLIHLRGEIMWKLLLKCQKNFCLPLGSAMFLSMNHENHLTVYFYFSLGSQNI